MLLLPLIVLSPGVQISEFVNLKASYVITTTDDFVIDAYLNGKKISDDKRTLLWEKFGATSEKFSIQVHRGDWLVFHVVNNRMRWGGSAYFGVAGCFAENEFGFKSGCNSSWSYCSEPKDSERFISKRSCGTSKVAHRPEHVWDGGESMMKSCAGNQWNGEAIWGDSNSVWIKYTAD